MRLFEFHELEDFYLAVVIRSHVLIYKTEEKYWIENREFIGIKSLCSIRDRIWSLSVEDLRTVSVIINL